MKSSKLRHAWTFFLEATELKAEDSRGPVLKWQVELEHSRFTGKKKVLVDGKLVFSTTEKQLSWCWEHPDTRAKIKLESENGRHSLKCEEPKREREEDAPTARERPELASPRPTRTADEELKRDLSAYCAMDDEIQEDVDVEIAEEAIPSFPSGPCCADGW